MEFFINFQAAMYLSVLLLETESLKRQQAEERAEAGKMEPAIREPYKPDCCIEEVNEKEQGIEELHKKNKNTEKKKKPHKKKA